jgi:hypothetical protein
MSQLLVVVVTYIVVRELETLSNGITYILSMHLKGTGWPHCWQKIIRVHPGWKRKIII